jgi:hypothetical protein
MVMMLAMNRLFSGFFLFFEALGKARAAAELSRLGKYDEAKRIVSGD